MSLREGVDQLLNLIDSKAQSLESPPEEAPQQFAAAGLMRCCALLRGIRALEDAGLGPVIGILDRQHWETWLVSLHVLLRGDEALREIAGDDIFWKRLLSEKLKLGFAYHDDWQGKVAQLNFKTLADGLKPLLVKAGEPGDPDGVTGYDVSYRVQSLFAVHAGLATIGSYLQYGDKLWSVTPYPPAPFPRPSQTPALHTAHLAKYVFEAFGLATEPLDQIWDSLMRAEPTSDPHVM